MEAPPDVEPPLRVETARADDSLAVALTAAEAAHHLGMTEQALAAMRARNMGPAYIKYGRAVRYLPEDIRAWWSRNRVQPPDSTNQ